MLVKLLTMNVLTLTHCLPLVLMCRFTELVVDCTLKKT